MTFPPDADPTDAELATPGPQRSAAYDRAWEFATFVAQTRGVDRLRALYVAACGPGHPDAATAAARFANEEEAFVYSRFSNPTVMMMERRLAALEGTEACIGTSSGMSAIMLLVMGLLKAGDHVVCSRSVFGSTIKLLQGEFGKFGVQVSFVSQTDLSEWKAALQPNTRLLFAETPTNPLTEICDVAALAEIAHGHGALLAVDNCFASPALQQPAQLGADFIIHSGTKYLDGQGRVIAGAICASTHYIDNVFTPVMRSVGMSLSPFNAWVVLKGMETLGVRMKAQTASAALLFLSAGVVTAAVKRLIVVFSGLF